MNAIRTIPRRSKVAAIVAGMLGNAGFVGTVMTVLIALQDRSRQRRVLQDLDDRLLRDVGLSKDDVRREARRSFWRG